MVYGHMRLRIKWVGGWAMDWRRRQAQKRRPRIPHLLCSSRHERNSLSLWQHIAIVWWNTYDNRTLYKYNVRLKLPIPLSAGQFLCHSGLIYGGMTSVVLYESWLLLLLYLIWMVYFTIYMENIILSLCHGYGNKLVDFLWYLNIYYVFLLSIYNIESLGMLYSVNPIGEVINITFPYC